MADWVGSVVTGGVGVVGIAATFLTGRSARRSAERTVGAAQVHETSVRLRDERRLAYTVFLAVVEEDRPWQLAMSPIPDPLSIWAMLRLIGRASRFRNALAMIKLVASPEVDVEVERVRLALRVKPALLHRNRIKADDALSTRLQDLRSAMQRDLGY